MFFLGCHMADLVFRLLGTPEKITVYNRSTGIDGLDVIDYGHAVWEYPHAVATIRATSTEINGGSRRQLVVCGSKGTVNIVPIERPTRMTYADLDMGCTQHNDVHTQLEVTDLPANARYDEMMQCFHGYITGEKQNPYSYHHDYLVQKLLMQIVEGM